MFRHLIWHLILHCIWHSAHVWQAQESCELTMVYGSGEPCRSCLLYHSGAAQVQRRREGAKKGVEEQRLEQTDVFKKLSWQMKNNQK